MNHAARGIGGTEREIICRTIAIGLPSGLLQAMGVDKESLHSAMRISLDPELSMEDVIEAARRISQVVRQLRHAFADVP